MRLAFSQKISFPTRSFRFVFLALLPLASCSREPKVLVDSGRALSTVAAEETAKLAGMKKQIVLIVPEASWKTASTITSDFEAALKKHGFSITTQAVNVGDPMRGDFGLKAADFLKAIENSNEAGAIVSFAGAPLLKPNEFQQTPATHPPILVIAVARLVSGDHLQVARLLDAKIIQAAIIDGADPQQSDPKTDSVHKTFAANFRILR